MAYAATGSTKIWYETEGDPSSPALVLVAGLGAQLTSWSPKWRQMLVEEGFFVICFDNRDAGLSTHLSGHGAPDLARLLSGGDLDPPYLLEEMAGDAAAVLVALGVASAHVVGISMGGMIAQQLAISQPEMVSSLCSIMSTTGDPSVGQPTEVALASLLVAPARSRDEAVEQAISSWRVLGSPAYPFDEEVERRRIAEAYDRSHDPDGVTRQLVAIISSPDRTAGLGEVAVPTLVVHGECDILVQPSGGRATAAAVAGSQLMMVEGMGHDLPVELYGRIIDAVVANTRRAPAPAPRGEA